MDLELRGKKAMVTGGGRGIGKAVARVLAEEGVDVAICSRTKEQLDTAAAEVSAETGRKLLPIVCDVSKLEQVEATVKAAADGLGGIDILVNNAGVPGGLARGPIETVTDDDVLDDLNTKFMGYLRFSRSCVPYMKQKGWGRIVNIGGMSARRSGTYSTGARNVAVAHLTKTMSDELGQYGITANAVHPGATMIEMLRDRFEERARSEGRTYDEVVADVGRDNAIRRIVDASEVAFVGCVPGFAQGRVDHRRNLQRQRGHEPRLVRMTLGWLVPLPSEQPVH